MADKKEVDRLRTIARDLRFDILDTMGYAGGAHVGGSFSMIDVVTALYFKFLNLSDDPNWEDRDRFILSKGHCALGLIPTLMKKGYIDKEGLKTFNKFKSPYGMHPDSKKIPGCDASTGSLGHGLPMAAGMAIGARFLKKDFKVVCMCGDGEMGEGSNWEALMTANHYKLSNLILIVDRNKYMIDGPTEKVMSLEPLDKKLEAFGLDVQTIDGHDFNQIIPALEKAFKAESGKPQAIISNSIKGKGLGGDLEDNVVSHYCALDSKLIEQAKANIQKLYEEGK